MRENVCILGNDLHLVVYSSCVSVLTSNACPAPFPKWGGIACACIIMAGSVRYILIGI